MKNIFILTLTILFSGCMKHEHFEISEKESISNRIMKKVALQLKKETCLIPCGNGGEAMNEIKMLALAFDCRQPIDIAEGRLLLIKAVEEFINTVNANPIIRPYLVQFPFKPENVEIRIFIHDRSGNHFGDDSLCIISSIRGILSYKTPDHSRIGIKVIYKETYDEALKILEETQALKRKDPA